MYKKRTNTFLIACLYILINISYTNAIRNCASTGVPLKISGVNHPQLEIEIVIANYSNSASDVPQFGEENDVHYEVLSNDTIRVYFHPKNCYDNGCLYFCYVGVLYPEPPSCSNISGYEPFDVKIYQVNFTGSFRLLHGNCTNRRSFYITPAYAYGDSTGANKMVCAFNNHGGLGNTPVKQAYIDHSDGVWWHNIYYGTWYTLDKICPNNEDSTAASELVHFNEDLNKASERAQYLADSAYGENHFNTDKIYIYQACIGPEYIAGNGSLVFDVTNLNIDTVRISSIHNIATPADIKFINIYPTPSHSGTTIDFQNPKGNAKLDITTVNGKLVFRKENIKGSRIIWDSSKYPNGIYLIKITIDDKPHRFKFTLVK